VLYIVTIPDIRRDSMTTLEGSHVKKTARLKLNAATINGCLIISAIVALVFKSWLMFVLVATALLLVAVCAGDIRLTGGYHKRR